MNTKHKYNCHCDDCLESRDRYEDLNKSKHRKQRRIRDDESQISEYW